MFVIIITLFVFFVMVGLMRINPKAVDIYDFTFCLLVAFVPFVIFFIFGNKYDKYLG